MRLCDLYPNQKPNANNTNDLFGLTVRKSKVSQMNFIYGRAYVKRSKDLLRTFPDLTIFVCMEKQL